MFKNNKGFTLVELIIIIVVLGVLAAIAIPRYGEYKDKAGLAQIKADMSNINKAIVTADVEGKIEYSDGYVDKSEIETAIIEGKVYKQGHFVDTETPIGGTFNLIKRSFVDDKVESKLNGSFLLDERKNLYFVNNEVLLGNSEKPNEPNEPNEPEPGIYLAKDTNFEWVENSSGYMATNETKKGYYKYIGNETEIEIPHTINGHPMTSYYRMFYNIDLIGPMKIVSNNKNIENIAFTFARNFTATNESITSINLSDFDTSNVSSMLRTFSICSAKNIDISTWDTSNVTTMNGMFANSEMTNLDLAHFDTSKVTDMRSMFSQTHATSFDLSSFDTSNVTNMSNMFESTKSKVLDLSSFDTCEVKSALSMFSGSSVQEIYTRTSKDVEILSNRSSLPEGVKFIVK